MFIFNVLPLCEFRSPKSQFAMVNVCVLSMYYHVLLMYFPRKREGSLTAKSHYFQRPAPAENTQKFQRITQILHSSPTYSTNYAKFTPIINPFILHYVSGTCPGRELSGIPANYANSAQFAHIVRKTRKIRTIC